MAAVRATNQLLAGLAFLVITFWLWRRNLPVWFIAIPMVFMLILPGIAMSLNVFVGENSFLKTGNWLLVAIGCATLALQIWMIIEAMMAWPKAKGILEAPLPPLVGQVQPDTRTEGEDLVKHSRSRESFDRNFVKIRSITNT